jgi:hypothetical protein
VTKRATVGPLFVIGDVHGEYEKLAGLLSDAGLVRRDLAWSGGGATLWFLGDFFDRGPDGTRVVDRMLPPGTARSTTSASAGRLRRPVTAARRSATDSCSGSADDSSSTATPRSAP